MRIIAIMAGVVIVTAAYVARYRHVTARNPEKLLPSSHTGGFVPLLIDIPPILIAFIITVADREGLSWWQGFAVYFGIYCLIALPGIIVWEWLRGRHNRQVEKQPQTSVNGSIGDTESVSH